MAAVCELFEFSVQKASNDQFNEQNEEDRLPLSTINDITEKLGTIEGSTHNDLLSSSNMAVANKHTHCKAG